jgi:hypothetical protein
MASSNDVLHLKTDAELRFFVENPSYYQAELVAAARRELRRRYPAAPLPAAGPPGEAAQTVVTEYDVPAARQRPAWLLPGVGAAVLLVAGLSFWGKGDKPPRVAPVAATATPAARPAPPTLETAITAPPLPTFDTERCVKQALARVPVAEKANDQRLSQYQIISHLFWAAQKPTAYLLGQVQQGKPNPVFKAQANMALALWTDFDRTLVYSYSFEPVMADHFGRMKTVARQQRAALTELLNDTNANLPLRLEAERQAEQQAMPPLLAPLGVKPG